MIRAKRKAQPGIIKHIREVAPDPNLKCLQVIISSSTIHTTARPTLRKLYDTIRSLTESPYRGRPSSEEGTREIVFPPANFTHRQNTQVEELLIGVVDPLHYLRL